MNSVNAGRQTVITAEASTCGRFVATVLLHIVLFGIRKRNYACILFYSALESATMHCAFP
jgi:hypothetical protein